VGAWWGDQEVQSEAALHQDARGIATDAGRDHPTEAVLLIESEDLLFAGDGALVGGLLPEIFALVLHRGDLEGADCGREELDRSNLLLHLLVVEVDRRQRDHGILGEPGFEKSAAEILDVHCPRKAFAPEDFIRSERLGDATVSKNVGEAKLAAFTENPVDLVEDGLLVGTEVNHTIRNHNVNRGVGNGTTTQLTQIFNIPLVKNNVGLGKIELLAVIFNMLCCNRKLFISHINTDHAATGANERAAEINISSSPAPKIQNCLSVEKFR